MMPSSYFNKFSSAASSITVTPNSSALASLLPASAPATTGGFGAAGGFGATTPGASAGGFGGGGVGSTPPATTASGKKIVPDDPSAFPLQ